MFIAGRDGGVVICRVGVGAMVRLLHALLARDFPSFPGFSEQDRLFAGVRAPRLLKVV